MLHDSHIPDNELLLAGDGELSSRRSSEIRAHLAHCWKCRTRWKEIEGAIEDFTQAYHQDFNPEVPSPAMARANLKAQLRQLAAQEPQTIWHPLTRLAQSLVPRRRFAYIAGTFLFALTTLVLWQSSQPSLASNPNPALTPGATLPMSQADVCTEKSEARPRFVLASVGQKVFEEYGIRNPKPGTYELDYLIDADLGGSDDARNLWPQPYSAQWNAHVKDALENHLRELVCAGKISLAQAQQDISLDWTSAYRKYFRTDRPLADHLAFRKDQPWE
jgi:hypothetical protein